MGFQQFVTERLASLTASYNDIAKNAKRIFELPVQNTLDPSSLIHVSRGGESESLTIQKIIDAITNNNYSQLLSVGEITVSGLNISVPAGASWVYQGVNYQTSGITNITETLCAAGYLRKDILVANQLNQIILIKGAESETIRIKPNIPIGTVLVNEIDVDDAIVGTPSIPIIGNIYVKLTTDQTIDGVKTFANSPIVPDATLPTQAVNLGQLKTHLIAEVTLSQIGITTPTYTKAELEVAVTAYRQTLPFNAVYDIVLVTNPPPANRIEFTTGNAPSISGLETILGITLINPIKTGDVITFDNVNYSIPNNAFALNTNILSFDVGLGVSAGNYSFYGCVYLTSGFTNLISAGIQCFDNCVSLISQFPNLTFAGVSCFRDCNSLTSGFTNLITAGSGCFKNCVGLINLNFQNLDNFGTTSSDNSLFDNITGNTINVTAKSIHQTSNAGGLEGDLAYLQANNTVTFTWV